MADTRDKGWTLVTGAGRGLGESIARKLAASGRRVLLWGRDGRRLDAVRDFCSPTGRDVISQVVDVRDEAAVSRRLREIADLDRVGLSAVVLNAGVGEWNPVADTSLEAWRTQLDTNLTGAFIVLKHALPFLTTGGSGQVVVVGSDSIIEALPGRAAYTASKAGLRSMIDVLRAEYANNDLRISHLTLGSTDTYFRGRAPGDRPAALSPGLVAAIVVDTVMSTERVEIRDIHLSPIMEDVP